MIQHFLKSLTPLSKFFLIAGVISLSIALLIQLLSIFQIPLGKLPGDIYYKGKNSSFYFPITTCIIISIILSAISYFFKD